MAKMIEGTLAIRNRLGVSEATLMDMINFQDLPAEKNKEGVFCISEADLEKWQGRAEAKEPLKDIETKEAKAKAKK